jgi:hypothetical protein
MVRDHLKNTWAINHFGKENVCAIGNYTTFGIKSSLIDMARVHNKSRTEILDLTTKIGLKDEDGKALTWEKALEQYKELKTYCDANPDVADAASRLLNRNRGMGMHAGGLIISNQRIDNLVPLVKGKDGQYVSAFVEGLHGTDLGPLGLIKFDLLVITNLMQIAKCCKIIKERHGLASICALPGRKDWSDTAYLNDAKALALASEGKLKCIFQFDSEGIRELVRRGGVTSFDDLVAYSALYRPGPLGMKMDERYIERKRGREGYTLHPVLRPILGNTYGVMCYQEQVMKILRAVGNVPDMHCEIVRKAISKKKIEIFGRYKEMFIRNGQQILGWTEEQVSELWDQIASFAEYGFNKSVTAGTLIPTIVCGEKTTKKIEDFVPGDLVFSVNEEGRTVATPVVAVHNHGVLNGYEVTFDDGYKIVCSIDHKFLTKDGQKSLREICRTRSTILCDQQYSRRVNVEEMGSEMRGDSAFFAKKERSSQNLREVSVAGLAEERHGGSGGTRSQMWEQIPDLEITRTASKRLQSVFGNQTKQHSSTNGKIESRQSCSREEGDIFRNCQEDFGSTRNFSSKSQTIERMEKGQPRKVCSMHRSGMEKFQTIKDGTMAEICIGLGDGKNTMRRISTAGRFSSRTDLDRNRRSLSFQRAATNNETKESFFAGSSIEGCLSQQRSDRSDDSYVDSSEHGVFQIVERGDERGMVPSSVAHAGISDTRGLVSREIVRVCYVGQRQMYDLEVACPTHNFILPTGIVTSNSHAVAYAYISARLLWLKAHYPLEFFAAILSCEDSQDKIKEYKTEAEAMGIKLERVDINKSRQRFDITDDTIYMGFGNIKGIGDEVADKIVAGQPYAGFEDFLKRFGTEAKVLKPLIALKSFKDADRAKLYEYYEYFKDAVKKQADRAVRHNKAKANLFLQFKDAVNFRQPEPGFEDSELAKLDVLLTPPKNHVPENIFELVYELDEDQFAEFMRQEYGGLLSEESVDMAWTVVKKYRRSVEGNKKKNEEFQVESLEEFVPNDNLDDDLKILFSEVIQEAEQQFYGFCWDHLLETSPDFQGGRTFADFDEDETTAVRMCEVQVIEPPKERTSAKGTSYYMVKVEDANSRSHMVTFWQDDYDRFKEELNFWESKVRKGHFLRLRLKKPEPPFKNYTFDAPLRQLRWKELAKNKEDDHRLQVMARPTIVKVEAKRPVFGLGTTPLIDLKREILEF